MVTLLTPVTKGPHAHMPEAKTFNAQQKIGGLIGVLLLVFAMGYRFLPGLLSGHDDAQPVATTPGSHVVTAPMGFERPAAGASVADYPASMMGPPISMASSEVISAYRRSANAPPSEQLAQWLQYGDTATVQGNLAGDDASAVSWYAKVLEADEDNRAARAGVAEVARKLASRAHSALADGEIDKARKLLDTLRGVPLADAETARIAHRLKVYSTVTPMLGEAAALLEGAPVSAARRAQALALYRKVVALDDDNRVAHQGLVKIQRHWLDRALAAVAQNDYQGADVAVARAAVILPASRGLQNTRSRIEGMRRMRAGHLLAQARSALDSGDLALARKLADQAVGISPDVPGVDKFNAAWKNARLYGGYRPGQQFADHFVDRLGQGPEMVVLPIGRFMMGRPEDRRDGPSSELPQHQVSIDRGIAMARSEISVAEFREFIEASGYQTEAERLGGASVYDRSSGRMRELKGADWEDNYAGRPARDDQPVVNVSWNDAAAYTVWLSKRTGHHYRLPSESEFEYALRGGTRTPYWWGKGSPTEPVENVTGAGDTSRSGRRWIRAFDDYDDGYWGPAPTGHYKANPFGLHDMSGNVSEWVADCWHDNYTRAPRDGRAWINPGCDRRVIRGGSWGSSPGQVRSAFRLAAPATARSGRVGFRVVRELDPRRDGGGG